MSCKKDGLANIGGFLKSSKAGAHITAFRIPPRLAQKDFLAVRTFKIEKFAVVGGFQRIFDRRRFFHLSATHRAARITVDEIGRGVRFGVQGSDVLRQRADFLVRQRYRRHLTRLEVVQPVLGLQRIFSQMRRGKRRAFGVPPMSSAATYRLSSAHRGAQGFFEFASESTDFVKHVPIYIYDRLDEPTRGMLEENLAYAEGGEMCVTFATGMAAISGVLGMLCENGHEIVAHQILYGCTYSLVTHWLPRYGIQTKKDFGGVLSPKNAWNILVYGLPTLSTRMINQQKTAHKIARFLQEHPKVARVVYPGLESHPQFELAKRQMVNYEGKFSPGAMIYFVLKNGANSSASERGGKFIDYVADHAYSITLAVSLGQIKTLIESPYSMTHSALPEEEKLKLGMEPGGIRLAIGLEDWHDLIEDLREALEQV